MEIRVDDHRELQAVILALKAMDRDLRSDISRATRQTLGPIWKQEIAARTRSLTDERVLAKGAAVRGGNPAKAVAATSSRRLSGGLVPNESWAAFEFGSNRNKVSTYSRRSPKGKSHKVTRHTNRQLPARQKSGRVVFPAFANVAPRMASLWTQLVVKKTYEAFEGK